MDLVKQYMLKVEHHLTVLSQLEQEYANRPKSTIYLEKKRHNKNAAEHWRQKIFKLGRESNILLVKFEMPFELQGYIHITKKYRTLYIGINEDLAKQLILMENPEATNFTFKTIQPGILKEI